MNHDKLRSVIDAVQPGHGWDFSRVQWESDPLPWSYSEIVRRYLSPVQRVLDLGTGGGELFIRLAEHYGSGVGIDGDPNMVAAADANLTDAVDCRVKFLAMDAAELQFPAAAFDVVLCRHAPAYPAEVARVLKPGGVFITQQIGARNHHNITTAFGCGPAGEHSLVESRQTVAAWAQDFAAHGCAIRAQAHYDVPYYYRDVESLVFWMKALGCPPDLDAEAHVDRYAATLLDLVTQHQTPRGIATNVHRELLIVQR
jgi:SAM-dependent methyltransferase